MMSLTFLIREEKILLGMKKKGLGSGWWNGFGGKVEPNESIPDGARREMREEASIELGDIREQGIVQFSFEHKPLLIEAHIFRAAEYAGVPTESDEMRPEWFAIDAIPYEEMWKGDALWLPLLIAGKQFSGAIRFGEDGTVLRHDIRAR